MATDKPVEFSSSGPGQGQTVNQMVTAQLVYDRERLIAAAGSGLPRCGEQLVSGLPHRGDYDDRMALLLLPDNPGNPRYGFFRFDGGPAELHNDHELVQIAFGNHELGV